MSTKHLDNLHMLRQTAGPARTRGLEDRIVERFLSSDARLGQAITAAVAERDRLAATHADLFGMDERELCKLLQERLLNFYVPPSINPYVPLAASGPWIITTHGAVVHDSGGYGMLGMGHMPESIQAALSRPCVMANVMTPAIGQKNLTDRLVREIGHTRGSCPFAKFVCLNSGSESVTFACRMVDIHARRMTDANGRHAGKKIQRFAIVEGFHGRTEGPARLSDSCRKSYAKHLASFRDPDNTVFLPVNDNAALRKAFDNAERNGIFVEALFVEPVMGEGIPGLALDRAYYDQAWALTRQMGSLLVVDSIQAALRAHGCLSVIDYPGYETCEPPDIETYSKALNAGQFPLSIAALREEVAATYVHGLYGNTMTTNPRAMEVACAVLDGITEDLRQNIRDRGKEFVAKFERLAEDFPGTIDRVVGTGLMVCALLNPQKYVVVGEGGFEQWLRINGCEMIHGGEHGLRFTPSFDITSAEVDMIVELVGRGLQEIPANAEPLCR
jgi:acetylornithine/succinyldiaminopimelate/putrescine aminotransferase